MFFKGLKVNLPEIEVNVKGGGNRLCRSLVVPILMLFTLAGCSRATEEQAPAALLGAEPVPAVVQCAESYEVFSNLARRNRKGLTLLHLSAADNLSLISGEKISGLRDILKKKRLDELQAYANKGDRGYILNENYLFAASRLGFVKEIYWVIPSKLLEYSDAERRVRTLLTSGDYAFLPEEAAALRYKNGCVSGPLFGVAVNICGVETLPVIPESVVLDIDAGFFVPYAADRGLNVQGGLKDFFDKMAGKKINASEAFIRTTLREGTLSPLFLHIPSALMEILKTPLLLKSSPPEIWSLADTAAMMIVAGAIEDAASLLKKAGEKYRDDDSTALLNGIVTALKGDSERGSKLLSKLCAGDRVSCYSFIFLGKEFRKQGKGDQAIFFFTKSAELRPDLTEALYQMADMKMRDKDYKTAFALYVQILAEEEGLSARMGVADSLYFLNKHDEARKEYAAALEHAENTGRPSRTKNQHESFARARALFLKNRDFRTVERIDSLLSVQDR